LGNEEREDTARRRRGRERERDRERDIEMVREMN
tara:strand:- start:498 stop:599 length:102 start_codon:yes stop_codon:yes gene_type:complete